MNLEQSQLSDPRLETPVAVDRGTRTTAVVLFALLLITIPVGFSLGGAAEIFAQTGILYFPFLILAALAYVGQRNSAGKILTILWLLSLIAATTMVAVMFSAVVSGVISIESMDIGGDPRVLLSVLGLTALGAILGLLAFLPPLRRLAASVLPMNPDSFVHATALASVIALTFISFVPLFVLAEPPILSESFIGAIGDDVDDTTNLLSTIFVLVWSVPAAIFAVGYGIRRDLGQSLRRLGLVRPSMKDIAIGIGVALALVVVASGAEILVHWIWSALGWPQTDGEAFYELISFAFSPLGALVIGVSAGLGEELAIRGVLQKRLGILLSNLFFTAMHAFQYNWDALIIIFVLGSLFGILRRRTNTTTSAIAHGLYDFVLIMMATYGISLFG